MAVLGEMLKNRRAGQDGLAWNLPNLAGPDTLALSSPDIAHESAIHRVHAGKRIGGQNVSPELTWLPAPQ